MKGYGDFMKKMNNLFALLLALCLSFSLAIPCLAASAEGNNISITEAASQSVEPIAASVPTEYRNLSSQSYSAELVDLAATKSSLTLYYFTTGTGEINLSLDLLRSGTTEKTKRVLKVYLYERTSTGTWKDSGKSVSVTFYGTGLSTTKSFTSLDANKFYYLKFKNESSTKSGDRMDISGDILVTE